MTITDETTEPTQLEQFLAPRPDASPEVFYWPEEWTWDAMTPSPHNPRSEITDESVADLADSIASRTLLQRIQLHPDGEIIAGHRRYHAIGLLIRQGRAPADTAWPIEIRHDGEMGRVDEGNVTLDRLVENLMRKNLDPIEEARGMQAAIGFGFTAQQLADQVGVTKDMVTKRLALLALTDELQAKVSDGVLTLDNAILLSKQSVEDQTALYLKHKGHVSRYDIEGYVKAKERKAAKEKLVAELKAQGHTVRASAGPAKEGKIWVLVGNKIYAKDWDQSVPKSAEVVIVKQDQWAGSPEVSFMRQVPKPKGHEDLPAHSRGATSEKEIKARIERKQEQDKTDAHRSAVREAQARILLEQAKALSIGDFRSLTMESLVNEILRANWMSHDLVANIIDMAKPVQPIGESGQEGVPELPFAYLRRVLADPETSAKVKDRIVIAANVLGGSQAFEQTLLDHVGFDPDQVEIPEIEPMSEEEAQAIADSVDADEDFDEDLEEDVTYEGTEHPEFDG